ncbi:intermembrane phospholipid transport protein YdbH family protein [Marinobacter nanhaiticus]|nr:YdbH domain-containing protein [Marinobacter nanhaiticus]
MTRRRIGFWLVLILVAVVLAAGFWARQAWYDFLQANHIQQLDWQGLDLSLSSLSVDTFTVRQAGSARQIHAEGRQLHLQWTWNGLVPQVTAMALEQLQLDVQTQAAPDTTTDSAAPTSVIPRESPTWLPRQLTVDHFEITLPCLTGRCPLKGSMTASRQDNLLPAQAQLILHHQEHRVLTDVEVSGATNEKLTVNGSVLVDDRETLSLKTDFAPGGNSDVTRWNGSIDVPHLPRNEWILEWLRQWQALPVEDLPPSPDDGEVSAQWQLQWPVDSNFLQQATGSLSAEARLPQPWPLPGVGTLQGQLGLELSAEAGKWRAQTARTDMQLTEPANWIYSVPEPLRPKRLALQIQPAESLANTGRPLLPLALKAQIRGNASMDIDGHLALATEAPWLARLGKTRIRGSLPRYTVADWGLEQPAFDITATGQVDPQSLDLKLAQGSVLRIGQIDAPDSATPLSMSALQANLANIPLQATYDLQEARLDSLWFRGPVELKAQRLEHPQLKPQAFGFDGDIAVDLKRLALNGRIESDAGANADVTLRYPFGDTLTLEADARIDGKQAGSAWAETLTTWPKTLSVDDGAIEASARLSLPDGGPMALDTTLDADALGVTFNRMALTGIDGEVVLNIDQNQLRAHTVDLRVAQLNPGIPIGPVTAEANYDAPLDRPARGTLALDTAEAELLGGEVHLTSQRWDLADVPIRVPLQVHRLQLSRLMELYPAEDLSGTGILNGEIPVWIGPDGVHMEKGILAAEKPGGRLRLPGERLAGLAQDNAAMQIVVEAVKNFHYSVLDSTIDYARDGTLNLDLHIEGNNPDVRDGQPIVLNVNLEEDIPALLTSLQLSGRVNDVVTERVKKLIEQQQSGNAPDLEIERGIE